MSEACANTLPASTNPTACTLLRTVARTSALKMSARVAADREIRPCRACSGVPRLSSANPRTGPVSPPAKNRSLAGRSSTVCVVTWPCASMMITSRGNPVARPTLALPANTNRLALGTRPEHLRPHEASSRGRPPNRCDGRRAGRCRSRTPGARIDQIVPGIEHDRRRHRGQAHLREQAVDQQLVRRVDAFVEDPGALNLVAGAERRSAGSAFAPSRRSRLDARN